MFRYSTQANSSLQGEHGADQLPEPVACSISRVTDCIYFVHSQGNAVVSEAIKQRRAA